MLRLLLPRFSELPQYPPHRPVFLTPVTTIKYSDAPFLTTGGTYPGVNLSGSNSGKDSSRGGDALDLTAAGLAAVGVEAALVGAGYRLALISN